MVIWSLQVNIKTGITLFHEGQKKTDSGRNTLYLFGTPRSADMAVLENENLILTLEKNLGAIQNLNGAFSGVLITPGRISIFADRLSIHKVYYALDGQLLTVSNHPQELARLLGTTPSFDAATWAEMIRWSAPVTEHTFYKGIMALPQGKALKVNRLTGTFSLCTTDQLHEGTHVVNNPLPQTAQQLHDALRRSISCANTHFKSFAATISSGMDSRLMVGIARSLGIDLPLFCANTDGAVNEAMALRPVLNYWKKSLDYSDLPEDYYIEHVRQLFSQSDYLCLQHVWFAPAAYLPMHAHRHYLMGIGGGELTRFNNGAKISKPLVQLFTQRGLKSLVKAVKNISYPIPPFVTPEFASYLEEQYSLRLTESLKPFHRNPRGSHAWFLKTRFASCVLYLQSLFEDNFYGFSPYLDSRVLDLLFSSSLPLTVDDGSLLEEIYKLTDPGLLTFTSTRSPEAATRYPNSSFLNSEKTFTWIIAQLINGVLADKGLLMRNELEQYLENARQTHNFIPMYSLRALLAMEFWAQEWGNISF